MKSYLTLVNDVLELLREDSVISVDANTYSTLIGKFVNRAKRKVENAHNWNGLMETIRVTTEADTWRYRLTGATTEAKLLDVWSEPDDFYLKPYSRIKMTQALRGDGQTGTPRYYNINGVSSEGYLVTDLYPIPNGEYTIDFNMVIPQEDFTEDTEILWVPAEPVILYAWAMAVSERGENGGINYSDIMHDFNGALSDAIAIDAALHPEEYIFEVE